MAVAVGRTLSRPRIKAVENGVDILGGRSGLHDDFLQSERKSIGAKPVGKNEGFLRRIPALVTKTGRFSILERDVTFDWRRA
jgi:hypothetical protein